jgi:hypothetical protein
MEVQRAAMKILVISTLPSWTLMATALKSSIAKMAAETMQRQLQERVACSNGEAQSLKVSVVPTIAASSRSSLLRRPSRLSLLWLLA